MFMLMSSARHLRLIVLADEVEIAMKKGVVVRRLDAEKSHLHQDAEKSQETERNHRRDTGRSQHRRDTEKSQHRQGTGRNLPDTGTPSVKVATNRNVGHQSETGTCLN
jgi:hypothetical protein